MSLAFLPLSRTTCFFSFAVMPAARDEEEKITKCFQLG